MKRVGFWSLDHWRCRPVQSDLLGRWAILYIYPKDNTSGCTRETREFNERYSEFESAGVTIFGVSKDGTPVFHFTRRGGRSGGADAQSVHLVPLQSGLDGRLVRDVADDNVVGLEGFILEQCFLAGFGANDSDNLFEIILFVEELIKQGLAGLSTGSADDHCFDGAKRGRCHNQADDDQKCGSAKGVHACATACTA